PAIQNCMGVRRFRDQTKVGGAKNVIWRRYFREKRGGLRNRRKKRNRRKLAGGNLRKVFTRPVSVYSVFSVCSVILAVDLSLKPQRPLQGLPNFWLVIRTPVFRILGFEQFITA